MADGVHERNMLQSHIKRPLEETRRNAVCLDVFISKLFVGGEANPLLIVIIQGRIL